MSRTGRGQLAQPVVLRQWIIVSEECEDQWLPQADYNACFYKIAGSGERYPKVVYGRLDESRKAVFRAQWERYPVAAESFCWASYSELSESAYLKMNERLVSLGYSRVSLGGFIDTHGNKIHQATWTQVLSKPGECPEGTGRF